MANGDIASSVGWTTFAQTQDRKLGYDNDNYVADRAAEQFVTLRDKVLPAVNQPIFAVRRGSNAVRIDSGQWTRFDASPYAAPTINTGFSGWAGGRLTIKQAGIYRLGGHLQFVDATYERIAIQVVKIAADNSISSTLVGNVSGGGLSSDCNGIVRLAVGDVIQVRGFQRDARTGLSHSIDTDSADLTFHVEWLRA